MSHFSAIGFLVETENHYRELVEESIKSGKEIKTAQGSYRVWTPGMGVELWTQLTPRNTIMGANPHFRGKGQMPVRIGQLNRSTDYPLEGSIDVVANPGRDEPAAYDYPFMADAPDFELTQGVINVKDHTVLQIGAFAHEIKYFTDEADYDEQTRERKMAVQSAIPVGLFIDEKHTEKSAHVLYTGRVLEGEKRINPATEQPFYYALIETLSGTVDVVADIKALPTVPERGGIIQGIFWLSARLADAPDQTA
jgi:hypothetical protein